MENFSFNGLDMIEFIFLSFIFCFIFLFISERWGKLVARLLPIFLIAGLFHFLTSFDFNGELKNRVFNFSWIPSLGIDLNFILDPLALFFSILITLIGGAVFLYADGYLKTKKKVFSTTLLFFTASMLGLVQADNLIVFFIFWELTSISSFMLIAHKNEKLEAKDSSRTALFITVGGGLCLLVGFCFLSFIGQDLGLSLNESLSFSHLANIDINMHSMAIVAFIFIMLGVFTKSAQFPFHFWLPLAMSGPAPVSSFLHSATMVKAGVFLLLRIFPIYSSFYYWTPTLVIVGATTMCIGAILCISQTDLKRVLAYSTIGALGVLVMLIGHGSEQALQAALVFLLAHAFYKASLFQIAGNLELSTGNKNLKDLSNLKSIIPISAIAAIISVLSFIGMPPFIGFYGKELTYLLGLKSSTWGTFILIMSFLSFLFMGIMAVSFVIYPFYKKLSLSGKNVNPKPLNLRLEVPPFLLAILGLVFGLFPFIFTETLGQALMEIIKPNAGEFKLKLWHGSDFISITALSLSIVTIGLSFLGAFKIIQINMFFSKIEKLYSRFNFKKLFDLSYGKILFVSKKFTRFFQNGSLINYIRTILIGFLLVLFIPVINLVIAGKSVGLTFSITDLIIIFIVCAPLIFALYEKIRLHQIIYLALSGFGIIILFTFYSAIDLAITQLSVEALSIIFVLVLMYKLPGQSDKRAGTLIDVSLSAIFSIFVFLIMYFRHIPERLGLSEYYIKNSLSEAYGRNVVNVILVDFRSLDTFGEVIVVAIAAISVSVLIKPLLNGGKEDV